MHNNLLLFDIALARQKELWHQAEQARLRRLASASAQRTQSVTSSRSRKLWHVLGTGVRLLTTRDGLALTPNCLSSTDR